jgi:hypothetical protein
MKRTINLVTLVFGAALLQGCIAFPPLIQVEHKESAGNKEMIKRLDAIDQRLAELEKKTAQK